MKMKNAVVLFAVALCLTACGAKQETQTEVQTETQTEAQTEARTEIPTETQTETQTETETEIQTETQAETATEKNTVTELTQKELTEYSNYLSERDSYGFLLSSYDDVKNVNLNEVFYSGAGVSEQPGEEEKAAYLKETGEEELYTDLFYISTEKIDQVLQEKTGYTLQDMENAGNKLDMVYLEAYDAYFQEAGDTNYIQITCTAGTENADGTVTLECQSGDENNMVHQCTVTLEKGTRQFIKNKVTGA
jgi:hypothetical protein